MSIQLNQIVPWGRSRREYELMFGLTETDLRRNILGCGDGPASFNAEMSRDGFGIVSVDPLYAFSATEIETRFEATVDEVMSQVRRNPENWFWSYHRDPEDLCFHRREAMRCFLADYEIGRRSGRYLCAELPVLPFSDHSFDLALCSHLLFLYSDLLSEAFHVQSVLELCRVAREVRIFPLLTLRGEISPHVVAVRSALAAVGLTTEIVRVDYELQRGGNQMLRVASPSAARQAL